MRTRILGAAVVTTIAAATTMVAVGSVGASVAYYYYGYAGGSIIKAVDSTITSQLSASSSVYGTEPGASDANHLAKVTAQGVLSLGAVHSSAQIKSVSGGREVVVTARAADVSLLNGLVTAKAITTVTTTSRINGVSSSATHSDFAGLKIAGVNLPVNIPQNYGVRLGDIATIGINAGAVTTTGDYSAGYGAGLRVTLLKPEHSAGQGAEIDVNPAYAFVLPDSSPSTGHGTLGSAFATQITAAAGKVVNVRSDPTAPTTVFAQGTGGHTTTTSLAAVNLAPVGRVGAIKTTGTATNTRTVATITTTASVADVNLLGGLVTAKAVRVTAHADLKSASGSMTLVDLTIAGKRIPLSVRRNTVINLGIGKVTVNQQLVNGRSITVRAVDIVLGKSVDGLPAGAEIELASASAAAS